MTVVWGGTAGLGSILNTTADDVPLNDWSITPNMGAESEMAAANNVGRRIFIEYVKIWVIMPL